MLFASSYFQTDIDLIFLPVSKFLFTSSVSSIRASVFCKIYRSFPVQVSQDFGGNPNEASPALDHVMCWYHYSNV